MSNQQRDIIETIYPELRERRLRQQQAMRDFFRSLPKAEDKPEMNRFALDQVRGDYAEQA